jgi:hypothetical protein
MSDDARQHLHDYLDDELGDDERRELEATLADDDELAEELAALTQLRADLDDLPRPEAPGQRLTDAVMAQLPESPAGQARRPWWAVFTVSLRLPAWSVALLVLAFGLALWLARGGQGQPMAPAPRLAAGSGGGTGAGSARAPAAPTPAPRRPHPAARTVAAAAGAGVAAACVPTRVPVRFVLHAPKARSVSVAGDFNSWKRSKTTLADDNGNGVWTVTVYLTPGRYQYKFVVDGKWVVDPDAPGYHVDGFGGRNAVLSI